MFLFKRVMAGALAGLLMLPAAYAGMVRFDLNEEYTGATPPTGAAPWARATFASTTPGTVTLTLDRLLHDEGEYIAKWFFNLDPVQSFSGVLISQDAGPTATISTGNDNRSAGGGAKFDLLFQFETVNNANRFDSSWSQALFTITGPAWLTAESFAYLSAGSKSLLTSAHVQGIGPQAQASGWITGPEVPFHAPSPNAVALGGLGLLSLTLARRRM